MGLMEQNERFDRVVGDFAESCQSAASIAGAAG
jgi:hypothetical protein